LSCVEIIDDEGELVIRTADPRKQPDCGPHGQLGLLAALARAVDGGCAIEQAFEICLEALCLNGPWLGGRGYFANSGPYDPNLPSFVRWQPSDFEDLAHKEGLSARPPSLHSFSIVGGGEFEARLELYRDETDELTAQSEAAVELATFLLRRAIESSTASREKARAVEDRTHQLHLLKESEEALRDQFARLYTAINNTNHGLAMFDGAEKIVTCNDLYATMYRLSPSDVRPGTSAQQVSQRRRAKGFDIADGVAEGAFETQGGLALKNQRGTYRLPDGRSVLVSVQPLWDGGWVTTHEDITERVRFEDRISYLAHYDYLTDLANRVLFRERLDSALAHAKRTGEGIAVLWLDLDRFKTINDTMGHHFGDEVLKVVARRLRDGARETDLIARLGGDEFAILQDSVKHRTEAAALARRVRQILQNPIEVDGHCVAVEASIGICMAPADTTDADQIMRNADIALYRSKAEGRGTYRFFKPSMTADIQARRQLEVELRRAIQEESLELYYQPIVDLRTGEITSCEALLRWNHPERGPISPAEFIPLAEEAGLMVQLGRWVLSRACLDAAGWPSDAIVAVNVSPSQVMSRRLTQDASFALELSNLPATRLEIEITEGVLMRHTDWALQALRQLRDMGVHLALDDFGTGYSSLSYLQRFPFTKIKIDRSFIVGLPEDRNSHVIVKAITSLSRDLDMITTAEGVETESQLASVRALGCSQMQGFLFSRPVRNQDVMALLAARSGASAAA
jgi:diguanylate cyclase (GGDEF)-like protein